jgi:malonyl-CoA decarboxylase
MKSLWLERVRESVADRGRELLGLRGNAKPAANIEKLCLALLSEKGEASGTALAREVVLHYESMTEREKIAFFKLLNTRFAPDEKAIIEAVDRYRESPEPDHYLALRKATEPARQKLFRRINIAPNGIQAIVAIRADLLKILDRHPEFRAVDADLKYLLKSWFNRGFLLLQRIDWGTSAAILEKLINYESVHEIRSWGDLQRRLAADRRCFAFFHPALPEDPLIFVEVALVKGMSDTIAPLLDEKTPVLNPADADSVIFYSINKCLYGLRGISFGNFLIKQVATELAREFPGIKLFSTLSPIPLFKRTLKDPEVFNETRLAAILGDSASLICKVADEQNVVKAIEKLVSKPMENRDIISGPLERLGLAYLALVKRGDKPYDPVAYFHLSNGARLERINVFANTLPVGLEQSAGMMVNYRYIPGDFESNHEAFVHHNRVNLSRKLQKKLKSIKELW